MFRIVPNVPVMKIQNHEQGDSQFPKKLYYKQINSLRQSFPYPNRSLFVPFLWWYTCGMSAWPWFGALVICQVLPERLTMSFSFLLTVVELEYWRTLKGFLGQHKVEPEGKQCPCHGRVSECIYNVQGAAHDILISYQPEVIWGGCLTSKAFKTQSFYSTVGWGCWAKDAQCNWHCEFCSA